MTTGRRIVWGGIALMFVAVIGYAQYRSARWERERQEIIRASAGNSYGELFPGLFSRRWIDTKELPELTIGAKRLTKEMSWDDALPILDRGRRIWTERLSPDVFVEIMLFDDRFFYGFTFARSDGPYRLTTIESGTYKSGVSR